MSRWIDADALKEALKEALPQYMWGVMFEAVNTQPYIDIVFCENCRNCIEKGAGIDCPSGYGYLYCRMKKSIVYEDDYCSWGKERT